MRMGLVSRSTRPLLRALAALLVGGIALSAPERLLAAERRSMTPPSLDPDRWISFGRQSRAPFGDRKTTHLSTMEGGGLLDSATEPMGTLKLPHYDPKARRVAGGLAEKARENRKLEDRERRAGARDARDLGRRASVASSASDRESSSQKRDSKQSP